MAMCSHCDDVSVGLAISPATRAPKPEMRSVMSKAPGEVCLSHLMAWWPGRTEQWVLLWLERQGVVASNIRVRERETAIEAKSDGVKWLRRSGVVHRVQAEIAGERR